MKYCEAYAALLDPFIDGELSPDEMIRVQAHLDECPACRAYVDDTLAIRAAFPDVEETPVPDSFTEAVMARIQAEAAQKKNSRPWLKVLASLAACFTVVLLAAPMFSGGVKTEKVMESPAMAAAAPAMTAESAAEEDKSVAEAPAEAPAPPAAGLERQTAADNGAGPTEDATAKLTSEPAPEVPFTYAATKTVYAATLFLPPEASELLKGYLLLSESGTEIQYELTAEESDALRAGLEAAQCSYTSEDGIAPTTDMVLVILSK